MLYSYDIEMKSDTSSFQEVNFPEWIKFFLSFYRRNPAEAVDRTGTLDHYYKIDSKYDLKLPSEVTSVDLVECMEEKAQSIETIADGKYIDVFLSGGFDSATMYAAFLQKCDKDKVRAVFSYDEDATNKKALNQFNPALYQFIIDNNYNRRLLDPSEALHPDDSVSVIGHPGNAISNVTINDDYTGIYTSRRIGMVTEKWSDILAGDYDDKDWKELIKDIADGFSGCDGDTVVDELNGVIEAAPINVKDSPFKVLWWLKFVFSYTDHVIGPWYLMKDLSTERADNVISFFHSDKFQKYMMYTHLTENKHIKPSDGRNGAMSDYMLDFYKEQSIIDYSNKLPHQRGQLHKTQSRGIVRLNNDQVLDPDTFLNSYDSLKGIFFK